MNKTNNEQFTERLEDDLDSYFESNPEVCLMLAVESTYQLNQAKLMLD